MATEKFTFFMLHLDPGVFPFNMLTLWIQDILDSIVFN